MAVVDAYYVFVCGLTGDVVTRVRFMGELGYREFRQPMPGCK